MSKVIGGAVAVLVALLVQAPPAFAESPKPASRPALNLRQEIRVAVAHVIRSAPARVQAASRDSVKNGVIIGAIIGGAYGAVVAAVSDGELSTSGKVGVLWTSAAMGAGLGWLIDWMR